MVLGVSLLIQISFSAVLKFHSVQSFLSPLILINLEGCNSISDCTDDGLGSIQKLWLSARAESVLSSFFFFLAGSGLTLQTKENLWETERIIFLLCILPWVIRGVGLTQNHLHISHGGSFYYLSLVGIE